MPPSLPPTSMRPPRLSIPPSHRSALVTVRQTEQAAAERALEAAGRRAFRYLMSPAALRASVTSIDPRTDTYERALHVIERRTVVLGLAPAIGSRSGEEQPLPDAAAIDPWRVRPGELEARPKVVATCPTCDGSHKAKCRTCEGEGRVACDECDASGMVDKKPCEACDGTGGGACPTCHRGEIDCATCAATGRVRAWLALEAKTYSHVSVTSDGSGVEAHANVRSPSDFDAGQARWKNELFHDTGALRSAKDLPRELLPPLEPRMDRLRSTRVQSFASSVHRFPYDSPFGSGVIEVAGTPPEVTPASVFRPLRLRRAMLLLVLGASAWVAVMVWHGYGSRHPWFAQHGQGGAVLALGLAAAFFGFLAAGGLLVAPRAWSVLRTAAPAVVAATLIALTAAAARARGPSIAGADARLAAGDLAGAQSEAEAVAVVSGDRVAAARVIDTVHLERVRRAPALAAAMESLSAPWESPGALDAARADVMRRAEAERARATAARDVAALFALGEALRTVSPDESRAAFAAGASLRVDDCIAHAIFPCELHGSDLPESVAVAYERRLEVSYAGASIEKGDWDAALARIERWQGPLAVDGPSVRARAGAECGQRLAATLALARTTTDPATRRDLADRALSLGRASLRFTGHDVNPPIAVLARSLADAERALEAAERREVQKRGVWR